MASEIDEVMNSEFVLNQLIEQNTEAIGLEQLEQKIRLILDVDGVLVYYIKLPFENAELEFQMIANDRVLAVAPITPWAYKLSALVRENPGKYEIIVITGRKKRAEEFTRKMLDELFPAYELIMMPNLITYADPMAYRIWKASEILFKINWTIPTQIIDDDVQVMEALSKMPKRPKMPIGLHRMIPAKYDFMELLKDVSVSESEAKKIHLVQHYEMNYVIDKDVCRMFIGHILGRQNPWALPVTMREFVKNMKERGLNRLYLDNEFVDHDVVNYLWEEDVNVILQMAAGQRPESKIGAEETVERTE